MLDDHQQEQVQVVNGDGLTGTAHSDGGSQASNRYEGSSRVRQDVEGDEAVGVAKMGCKQQCLSLCSFQRWKYPTAEEARVLSYFSIGYTTFIGLVGLVLACTGYSASMLAFALDGIIDIASSVVILWRFSSKLDDKARRSRENRASVLIGLSFMLLGVIVFLTAMIHFASHRPITEAGYLLAMSIPSFLVLLFLGVMKIHVSHCLESHALFEDGLCSISGSVQAAAIFIGIFLYEANDKIWFIDPVFAMIISVGLFIYGLWTVRKYPFFTKSFWSSETKEGGSFDGEDQGQDGSSDDYNNVGIDLKPIDMDDI